jgi:hypothetical protein
MFVFPALNTPGVPQSLVASGRRRFQVLVIQNPMVQYQVQNPPPIHVLEKKNSIHAAPSYFFFFLQSAFTLLSHLSIDLLCGRIPKGLPAKAFYDFILIVGASIPAILFPCFFSPLNSNMNL